jgi:hypothetical protein
MTRFISCNELYETIQELSLEAKEVLWVCSPHVGCDAHEVFSQELLKNSALDIRFIFSVNDGTVKRGEVNPYEIQYLMDHFKNSCVKSHDTFQSKIYIFDQSALITSANLVKSDFESNLEAGVLIVGPQVDEVKSFFNSTLWENAKPIKDLKKYKKIWNTSKKNASTNDLKKNKTQTKITPWTNNGVATWYFAIPSQISKRTERKIKKETAWPTDLSLMPDIGLGSFKLLKSGDLAFIANLTKRQRKIPVEFARIFDKSRAETDEGDLHFAYETKKTYLIERSGFYEMLQNATIGLHNSDILLNDYQLTQISKTLTPNKSRATLVKK